MYLLFDQTKVPRSMSREGWHELHRWCRLARRRLEAEHEARLEAFRSYGHRLPEAVRANMIHHMVNPPLLLGPYQ